VRAFAFMGREFLRQLRENGSTVMARERMLDFAQINALLGLPGLLEEGRSYEARRGEAAE
jgi:hypothetical protein